MNKPYFCGRCGFVRVKTKPRWCAICLHEDGTNSNAMQAFLDVKWVERYAAEKRFAAMMERYQRKR